MTTHEQTNQTSVAATPPAQETLSLTDLARTLSAELSLNSGQIARTIALLDEGNTIPFIARYRKEVTDSLDEVQIQAIADRSASLRALHERKLDVHRLIDTQGKIDSGASGLSYSGVNIARGRRSLFALSPEAQDTRKCGA